MTSLGIRGVVGVIHLEIGLHPMLEIASAHPGELHVLGPYHHLAVVRLAGLVIMDPFFPSCRSLELCRHLRKEAACVHHVRFRRQIRYQNSGSLLGRRLDVQCLEGRVKVLS